MATPQEKYDRTTSALRKNIEFMNYCMSLSEEIRSLDTKAKECWMRRTNSARTIEETKECLKFNELRLAINYHPKFIDCKRPHFKETQELMKTWQNPKQKEQ